MTIRRKPALWICLLSLTICSPLPTYAQDLVLTAPPREKPAAGQKQYGPLAAYLSKLFGRTVKYVYPGNWLKYQRDMRDDKYDIVFDGPHFIAWRIAHLGNTAVVVLPGHLKFDLMVKKGDRAINNINDLVAKSFCGIPPPNLATLSVIAAFPNPVRQPIEIAIKGGAKTVYDAFMNGRCEAAVFRDAFVTKRLTAGQRAQLKLVYESPPFPNQGITVSKRVTPRERELMLQALTVGDGVKATMPILRRYARKARHMIPANNAEFAGDNNLLEGVIFGWE